MHSHTPRLRILWLSHILPYPPKGGTYQRSYNLIKRVAARHELHLIALKHKSGSDPVGETEEARHELLRYCKTVEVVDISSATSASALAFGALRSLVTGIPLTVRIYESAEFLARIRAAMSSVRFDLVHFETISLAQYLPVADGLPTMIAHQGAEAYMIRRRIGGEKNLLRKVYFGAEWLMLRRYEGRMLPKFGANAVVSNLDRDLMQLSAPGARYVLVENGVDVNFFQPSPLAGGRSLIFAGRLDQYSNRDGILYFMNDVWPGVKTAFPDATIDIIGANPPQRLRELAAADSTITVHGFVDDIRPYFARATAAICPLRDGGGTRIKIFDALAQAKPTVSTSIGAEGIDVVPERDLLIADSPSAFIEQIGRLFTDAELRARLSSNARALAENVYSWDRITERLSDHYVALSRQTQIQAD